MNPAKQARMPITKVLKFQFYKKKQGGGPTEAFGNITKCLPWAKAGLKHLLLAVTCLISERPNSVYRGQSRTEVFSNIKKVSHLFVTTSVVEYFKRNPSRDPEPNKCGLDSFIRQRLRQLRQTILQMASLSMYLAGWHLYLLQ